MVFPVESEDRALRNLLMMCQDHARLVVEVYRKVLMMIDTLVKGETGGMRSMLDDVERIHRESREVKRAIMKELHESGSILFNREDLFRLISKASEVNDYIESIGVRLWAIGEKEWTIPSHIGVGLVEMADAAFDTLVKLRESLISLGFNSERSLQLTSEVDDGERKVDSIHRRLDMDIVTSEAEIPLILTLREVSTHLEEMVDVAAAEADLIRILAL
jgi:predicted phosphate transport protein (TIGR00153 family)